jgi:hypothetical protein
MSRVLSLLSILKSAAARGRIAVLCLAGAFLALLPSAMAQTFTLSVAPFNFDAVDPGGNDSAAVTVNGSSVSVDLACNVTSQQSGVIPPICTVSPTSVTAPGSATATVNTLTNNGTATPGLYLITVTATGPNSAQQQQSEYLTVLSVAAQYTITVQTAVVPSSVPAGDTAQGVISVNPLNGYNGTVTLSCSSITPLVAPYAPYCTFTYPGGGSGVTVSGTPNTATLTIITVGPASQPTRSSVSPFTFRRYALLLPLPMLAIFGLGAAAGGRRSKKAWLLFSFVVLSGSALLLPACGTVSTTPLGANQSIGTTPNNSYKFGLTGIDTNGNPASNTGSSSAAPVVSLTVN